MSQQTRVFCSAAEPFGESPEQCLSLHDEGEQESEIRRLHSRLETTHMNRFAEKEWRSVMPQGISIRRHSSPCDVRKKDVNVA